MLWTWLFSDAALACGGFFCSNIPVDQTGEDVLFVVDEQSDETTVHVQISYAGEASDFAWVIPVAAEPEIVLSTDAAFAALSGLTYPSFPMDVRGVDSEGEECQIYGTVLYQGLPPAPPLSGTSVVFQEIVGPYEIAVLRARSADELLEWLASNGYDLPATIDTALAPYIAEESYFVALKLSQGSPVGALQPIALRYEGQGMSVPLVLTSVAASENMPVRVHVLASARAVPDSYLHATIDPLRLPWLANEMYSGLWAMRDGTYEFLVERAVDEAGQHAFVTAYAGEAAPLAEAIWAEGRYDIDLLASSATPYAFADALDVMNLSGDPLLQPMWLEFLPMPEELVQSGELPSNFYGCLECYASYIDALPFDAPAFAARIDERIVTPRKDLQEAFDTSPWLTRLETAISPSEMTIDPTFVLNRDLPQSVGFGEAVIDMLCEEMPVEAYQMPLRLTLPDGRTYEIPSAEEMAMEGQSLTMYIDPLRVRYAMRIEDLGATGPGTVLVDHFEEALAEAEAWNDSHSWEPSWESPPEVSTEPALDDPEAEAEASSCGCESTTSSAPLPALLAAALLAARRRAR